MIRAIVKSIVRGGPLIAVDYPVRPVPRWGFGKPTHPRLTEIIGRRVDVYERELLRLRQFRDDFLAIPETAANPKEPSRRNPYFGGLDALALYGFLRTRAPGKYFEIGSGHSTRFAARAIRDGKIGTRIISIDPNPRAEIDALADEIHRRPLEELDLGLFSQLQPGDFLFFDGSHLCFQNTDVVTFFLELLPELPPGVLVHVHDIPLPYDYAPKVRHRWYSEQYLFAMYLLGHPDCKILLPHYYVWQEPRLREIIEESCLAGGSSFWFET